MEGLGSGNILACPFVSDGGDEKCQGGMNKAISLTVDLHGGRARLQEMRKMTLLVRPCAKSRAGGLTHELIQDVGLLHEKLIKFRLNYRPLPPSVLFPFILDGIHSCLHFY